MLPLASVQKPRLPKDRRQRLGGWLFLVSLFVFFLCSILLYAIYASWRRADVETLEPLPASFLASTVCLLLISGLVHAATRTVRRERRRTTAWLLGMSGLAGSLFMGIQIFALDEMLGGEFQQSGSRGGVAGMVAVLAILHGLHVLGGVIALAVVSVGSLLGRYDHESHWPVDFAALYWHFLDLVWLCMLAAFWLTTGGFDLGIASMPTLYR